MANNKEKESKIIGWQTKRNDFFKTLITNLPKERIKEELGDVKKNWENDMVSEVLTSEGKESKKMPEIVKKENFTCSNCSREQDLKELTKVVEVIDSKPIKTCRECYNFYHNTLKKKIEEKRFFCSYCRFEVISVCFRRKVSVSMPNELGLVHGKTYSLCSTCNPKVREYNDYEDVNE